MKTKASLLEFDRHEKFDMFCGNHIIMIYDQPKSASVTINHSQ